MMEKDFEKYLKILNTDRCLKKPKEAGIILNKISECFNQEKSKFTIGLLIGLLLDENNAIFTFIWKTSADFETVSSTAAAFKLLEHLVDNFQTCIESYLCILFEKCIYLLDRKFARVKEVSLKLIRRLIMMDSKQVLELFKLVSELERHLRDTTKIPGSVSEQIYGLLGYLFEKYPESVKNPEWFLENICESLRFDCTVTSNPAIGRIKGAFEALDGYLTNYPPPDAKTSQKIYEYIKKISKFRQDKKAAGRVGLKVLQNHWSLFSNFIHTDREFWRINLEVWTKQKKEDRVPAFQFLCSFYSVIALFAKQEASNSEVKNYVGEFIETLQSSGSSYAKRAALVGMKLFIVTDAMKEPEFSRVYEVLMDFTRKHESYTSFAFFPLCIECLSAFVLKLSIENVTVEQLSYLQKLSVKLIDSYPAFEPDLQPDVLTALEKSFYMLGMKNLEIMENHIRKVVHQGLIKTCSTVTLFELELLKETKQPCDSPSYKSYLNLWKYLLTLGSSPNLPVNSSLSLKRGVASRVFDVFMESFLKIISKLNFNVGPDMKVEQPSDLSIFINVVDLYRDLSSHMDPFLLQKWLSEIFKNIIQLSRRNPLVSGFYKMTEANLKLADSYEFFQDVSQEKQKSLELVVAFLEETLPRIDYYKGELQLSCLKMILSAPVKVIKGFVEKTIPALEMAIHLAKSSFSLLKDLIDVLERWDLFLPPESSSKILEKILPQFDRFFQSKYFSGSNTVNTSIEGKKLKNDVVFNDSELLIIQKKFLMFLGQMDGSKAANLIMLRYIEKNSLSEKDLVYYIPFVGGNVEINLNEIMPRVLDLATSCIDRKTRITACELLYSGLMVLLGNIKQLCGGYRVLFREVTKTCLTLACDSDGVICQIFEPLMYQLMRYFSGKEALNFPESNDLIDILMDSVTRPYNPTLRDLSAHLIKEFTVWSVRQLTPEELKVIPIFISRILKNIYSLALHPSFNKRIGAAVVFNQIYSVLREEEFILDAYWFELFYHFMESLRMCEGPEENMTEILEAISHVKRPLVEKCAEFNEDSPERKVPPEFEGGRLCHLVKWTMERACDLKVLTRRTAMSLVQELAPLVQNCDVALSFVSKQFRNFFLIGENSLPCDLSGENFITWLNYQIAGFEYCTWLLEEKVLSTEEVFQPEFISVIKAFVSGVMLRRENSIAVEVSQQESFLAFLKLLYALRERAYLFPPELWDLLKMALFSPTALGFRINQTSMEHLSSNLAELLKYLSTHLTAYDWNRFYVDMETIVSVPSFSVITKNQEVDVTSWEFLFACDVIEKSGLWVSFREKVHFPTDDNLIIRPIFRSLFASRDKTVYAITLEPYCRHYLDEVLKVMLRVSEDLRGLLSCLENEEEVRDEETGKIVTKGEFFEFVFRNTLFEFLGGKYDLLLERVLEKSTVKSVWLLIQIVENRLGNFNLPFAVLKRWQDFDALNLEDTSQKNKLLLQLAISCAKAIGTPGVLKPFSVSEQIYDILENGKFQEIDISGEVFSLLPFLSDFAECENDRLSMALSKLDVDGQNSPRGLSSRNRPELKTKQHMLNGVLQSLKVTASLVLLRFALTRATWFANLCSKEDIESALNVFAQGVSLTHSVSALRLAYGFCLGSEKTNSPSIAFKSFLHPLLKSVPNAAVYQLVNENLENFGEAMAVEWEKEKSLNEIKMNMIKKICVAGILQTFVTKLSKSELDEMPKERRQLIDVLVKKAFFLLKYPYPPKVLLERYLELMREIFKMICCIVSARCTDEKFYKLFIFDERGCFLSAAINSTTSYNFDMDFEEIPKRKKFLTLLRERVAKKNETQFGQDSLNYIQTNTLFTSSLREDVTRFDLTHSAVRPMDSLLLSDSAPNVEIELEMDSLNSDECMPVLVATISKMVKDKITPGDCIAELPCWVKFFVSVLASSESCENFKLFVLKAIYNVQTFVAPYCRQIFPSILDSILELFKNRPLNYFLLDLIEMMIAWELPQDEKSRWQLTELVVLVLNKGDSFRRDIVRNNLEVLKTMVETWKTVLYHPELSSIAFKRLSQSVERDLRSNANGDGPTYFSARICGVLLSNGIPTWKKGSEEQFFQLVLSNCREDSRHNELFGEICGLGLKHIAKINPDRLEDLEQLVRDKILSFPACWLQVLYGICRHHPKMSSFFTYKIFSSAWDLTDSLAVRKLEMLLSHVSRVHGVEDPTFERHAHSFLMDMLNSPAAAIQELSLQIACKLTDKFDDDKLLDMLKEVQCLQKSVHSSLRKWVYEFCMKLYAKGNELKKECSIILLKGLSDGVEELEDTCLRFWRKTLEFSSPNKTLIDILEIIYTPETENIFLSNSVKILLQFVTDSGQLENPIFNHPITQKCVFQKRNLVLSSRQSIFRTAFSRTLMNESVEHIATLRHNNLPYLRPSPNSLMFEPTVSHEPEMIAANNDSPEENFHIPSNPFKLRFYKSEAKTNFSFANWQKKKKKKKLEEEESARKREMPLNIYGEYKDGDFPDIQLHHSQILKLFEALAKNDQHFARQFLVSLYSGMIKLVKSKEKPGLLSEMAKFFEDMLRSSKNFDPGVFGFVLQLILKHSRHMNIDCQLISNAAASSNWLSLGALILEETITNAENFEAVSSKRRKGYETSEEVRWLELVRLYRSLEEMDVVSGIFQDKLKVESSAREAIHYETLMNWLEASKGYEAILRTKPESNQSEFYAEAYFSCLAKLSNWSFLNKCIRSTVNDDMDELWKNYNLLYWFVTSEMMISLGSEEGGFSESVDEFCRHSVKRNILATNFGEELAAFDLLSNKLQRANYRIDRLCLDFLAGWSHLDQWSFNLRAAKLVRLQTLSELNFAVNNLAEVSKPELERNMKIGMKRWENNMPTSRDELTIWDVKLRYRYQFLKRLKDFDLAKVEVASYLSLAKAALHQENLSLAKEYLSRAKDRLPDGDAGLKAEHDSCFDLGKMVVAKLKMKDESVGLEMYRKVYQSISERLSISMETDTSDKSQLYRCNFTLGQLVSEMLPSVKKQMASRFVLESIRTTLGAPEGADLLNALQSKGLEHFEIAKTALENSDYPSATRANVYLELAKYLLKFSSFAAISDMEKLFEYTLRSMELGNSEARQFFGSLLNVSSHLEDLPSGDLLNHCDRVPSWMFLMWINQMLACLNSKLFLLLKSIFLRILLEYPNAIRYPLKLAEERESIDAKTKSFLIRLSGSLSKDRVYEDFWNSMKFLAPPESILMYHLENILQEASQSYPFDRARITRAVLLLKDIMFSSDYSRFRGPVFKVWEKVKEPVEDLLKDSDNKEALIRRIGNLMSSVETMRTSSKKGLESYSPWLHSFHSLKADSPLELPGQYFGDRQPIKKYLITVTSFSNNVLTFNSKCRPMRITILGNDATEHSFLIKFGDDLRQDERIQQVFQHFNYRLKESRQTKAFVLDTYKVIPLTHSLGMIEWMEDTVSLHEIMETSCESGREIFAKVQNAHLAFLSQGSPPTVVESFNWSVAAHLTGYENVKRETAITTFRARVQQFPKDLLKKSFLSLSTSPEHFAHIRKNFATSHAAMCITHWIVGINDRHLQNTLVSTRTGRVVGIDFGYAFGFGTQFLTPPELVPFRLTPQIVALLHPLDESGWIKQTMIHCLRLFRKDPFRLLSVIEVFAQEPLIDWLQQARKSKLRGSESPETWYPREKLSLVEGKLNGANPVAAFEADLKAGHSKSRYLNKYLEVLKGVPESNIRARCAEGGLTEVEQVECLIDLATDAHVLAKTYVGWNPWL